MIFAYVFDVITLFNSVLDAYTIAFYLRPLEKSRKFTMVYLKSLTQVKFKFDGYGIGHDQAEHHKFKWWERAFETAAASIEVGNG